MNTSIIGESQSLQAFQEVRRTLFTSGPKPPDDSGEIQTISDLSHDDQGSVSHVLSFSGEVSRSGLGELQESDANAAVEFFERHQDHVPSAIQRIGDRFVICAGGEPFMAHVSALDKAFGSLKQPDGVLAQALLVAETASHLDLPPGAGRALMTAYRTAIDKGSSPSDARAMCQYQAVLASSVEAYVGMQGGLASDMRRTVDAIADLRTSPRVTSLLEERQTLESQIHDIEQQVEPVLRSMGEQLEVVNREIEELERYEPEFTGDDSEDRAALFSQHQADIGMEDLKRFRQQLMDEGGRVDRDSGLPELRKARHQTIQALKTATAGISELDDSLHRFAEAFGVARAGGDYAAAYDALEGFFQMCRTHTEDPHWSTRMESIADAIAVRPKPTRIMTDFTAHVVDTTRETWKTVSVDGVVKPGAAVQLAKSSSLSAPMASGEIRAQALQEQLANLVILQGVNDLPKPGLDEYRVLINSPDIHAKQQAPDDFARGEALQSWADLPKLLAEVRKDCGDKHVTLVITAHGNDGTGFALNRLGTATQERLKSISQTMDVEVASAAWINAQLANAGFTPEQLTLVTEACNAGSSYTGTIVPGSLRGEDVVSEAAAIASEKHRLLSSVVSYDVSPSVQPVPSYPWVGRGVGVNYTGMKAYKQYLRGDAIEPGTIVGKHNALAGKVVDGASRVLHLSALTSQGEVMAGRLLLATLDEGVKSTVTT